MSTAIGSIYSLVGASFTSEICHKMIKVALSVLYLHISKFNKRLSFANGVLLLIQRDLLGKQDTKIKPHYFA